MDRRFAIIATFVAVLLALAVSHLWTRLGAEAAIARAETEARMLAEQRDSILTVVARNDSLQRELGDVRVEMEAEAAALRARIAQLEIERAEAQLSVRRLRRSEDLQARFTTTFPEIADSNWGVTEIVDDESGIGLEYLVVPLWFAETFLIDNQNAASFASQVESFEELSGIQDKVIELQDSIFTLERQTRTAYQTGYDNAFALYQNLNREHIELLRQPRISLGIPGGIATAAGTFGLGLLIGATR